MADHHIPNSLREKLEDERVDLYHKKWKLEEAIEAVSGGSVSSYSLGNRSVTYQNMTEMLALMERIEGRIDEIEAILCHRSARNVTVNTMLNPAICIPRR